MNLVVLGATGGTGLEVVRQALQRGHSVTALVRSPHRLKPFGGQITVKQGDLLSSADLKPVIQGHDAVVSAFGPRLPVSRRGRPSPSTIRRSADERHGEDQCPG